MHGFILIYLQGHWTSRVFRESLQREKECYKKFNDIVFVSNSAKEGFKNLFGDDFDNLQVKYNPIIAEEIVKKLKKKVKI